jgi:glutamate--cysteine ligase
MYTVMELPELTSRAQAEAHIRAVCFRQAPPTLIGAELELLTERTDIPGARIELVTLATALGEHTPKSIDPDSPALPLPNGGLVTVEPGGQAEISSAPFASAAQLCDALSADLRALEGLLTPHSIRLVRAAADAARLPELVMTTPRYVAGWDFWRGIGQGGQEWAANTASTQVSIDAGGDRSEIAARWNSLYTIGPALLSAFACSPVLRGMPDDGWVSQRMRTVLQAQPARTVVPGHEWTDPIVEYARWAIDVPLLCVLRPDGNWAAPPEATFADWMAGALDDQLDRRPGLRDLDYHLTTLYPPVRAQGHLEVRYLDGQPDGLWTGLAPGTS